MHYHTQYSNLPCSIVLLITYLITEHMLSSLLVVSFPTEEKNNRIREENKEKKSIVLLVGLENITMKKREIQKGREVSAVIKEVCLISD